jgi:hypothetical protein
MRSLNLGITEKSKSKAREGFGDIYKKDIPPEHTDNLDVAMKHT